MSKIDEKKISFQPDSGLLYLIQSVTGEPSDQILGFFFDFGKEVLRIGLENMTGKKIRKDVRDFYPGTAIPFKILVEAGQYNYPSIIVEFPDTPMYMDTSEMMDVIVERQLLGGSALPNFEKPKSRANKMYKDLIKTAIRDKNETVCDTGHSRETRSSTETT